MATQKPQKTRDARLTFSRILLASGLLLIMSAIGIVGLTFFPVIMEEIGYRARTITRAVAPQREKPIQPLDSEFGIIIPKLGANAHVIANVDPYDHEAYQQALSHGVAHARGTAFPGEHGNMFLFSHSSVNFYEATQYNAIFYLLYKLEKGDKISVWRQGKEYIYTIEEKKIALPSETSYLTQKTTERQLILMTCWPPGTNLKRLMVIARM